jgi:hypothetical protein
MLFWTVVQSVSCPFNAEAPTLFRYLEFSSYLKENTTRHHDKQQFVNAVHGNYPVYIENHTDPIGLNTKCRVTDC